MNNLLIPFMDQYEDFIKEIFNQGNIVIGTLGPEGTSSQQALNYFLSNISDYNEKLCCDIKLFNNFKLIYEALDNETVDYALIPTAYEGITNFFWNHKFSNNFNFIFPTPQYGVVCKVGNSYKEKRKIKVASCKAVENIFEYLLEDVSKDHQIEKVQTNSTTEAALALIADKVDLAITNKTSFDLYSDKQIEFISKTYNTNMLWSVFRKKDIRYEKII